MDSYLSIAALVTGEIKIKGSRFIGEAYPVRHVDAVEQTILQVKKREYAATHHCTAFRLQERDLSRYNDDGEPSGTAGAPILRQIDGRGLTDVLVVVTRYFGGVKLGTGGLVRAYSDAAADVLDRARVIEHVIRVPVQVRFPYDDTSPTMYLIHRFEGVIQSSRYGDDTELTIGLKPSQLEAFRTGYIEALAGRGEVRLVE